MAYKNLTDSDFSPEIKSSKKAVIDFYADWCGPCKMFAPTFEKVSNETKDVAFYKVNVDEAGEAAQAFSVMSIPTTIFFENGEEKGRNTGAMSESDFKEEIAEKLGA